MIDDIFLSKKFGRRHAGDTLSNDLAVVVAVIIRSKGLTNRLDVSTGTKGGPFQFFRTALDEQGAQCVIFLPCRQNVLPRVHHVERQGVKGFGVIELENAQIACPRRK